MSTQKPRKTSRNRRKSRELALKGLYRFLLNTAEARVIMHDLETEDEYAHADVAFFRELFTGTLEQIEAIDARLLPLLDRKISELSPVEHAILCLSAYELIHDLSIPYRVAINEGVELAKLYGGSDGYKYVNGVLDKLAAEARAGEVASKGKA